MSIPPPPPPKKTFELDPGDPDQVIAYVERVLDELSSGPGTSSIYLWNILREMANLLKEIRN